jgi:UDP-N-acetylglucosamine 2-epimerase
MRLKKAGTISSENLELRLVGTSTRSEVELIERFDLSDIVKIYPPVPKERGFRWMMEEATHLLYYGVPGSSTIISTKLLEYLNIGKPIIGVCRGNEAEDIIYKTNTGIVVDFDEQSIADAFLSAVRKEIDYLPNVDIVASFDRKSQAKRIAEVLNSAVQ